MNKHIELEQLKNLSEFALTCATQHGATQAEVMATIEDGFNITVRNDDIENVTYHLSKGLAIGVFFGKRFSSVSISDTSPTAIQNAVTTACNIAKFTQADECAGLAEPELMAQHFPDLDLFHPSNLTPEIAINLALDCEAQAKAIDKRIVNSDGTSIGYYKIFSAHLNSHNFYAAEPHTRYDISCSLISASDGKMERDFAYSSATDFNDLDSFTVIAREAAEKSLHRLGSRKITTQKLPVIFESRVAKSLLGNFIAAISGNNLYRKASFLCDHLDKQIFPEHVRIYERPFLLKQLGSSSCDSDGVATSNKDFIANGRLQNYVLGIYSARKLALPTTGNADGVHNLLIDANNVVDLPTLLKKMDTGILVTELIGQGINLVTGDYSRGAAGFYVENGQIQYPIAEFTIAGNLRDMFANLVAVGNDIDKNSNIKTGSILLEEMTIAG